MLNALLEKLGLRYESLTPEERKTYEAWAKVLATKEPTLEDLRAFLTTEHARAAEELSKWDNTPARELYFKALTHLAGMMQRFIASPAAERDALKAHLREVFHIDV